MSLPAAKASVERPKRKPAIGSKKYRTSLEDRDISPITLYEIPFRDNTLRFRNPLTVTPFFDPKARVFCIEEPQLGIDIFADSREDLLIVLEDQIACLWKFYALGDEK